MPLLSREEYEEELAVLERARVLLRKVFIEQQVTQIPELRTINGCEYKKYDDQLLKDIKKLEEDWKTTRFVVSQGKQKKREVSQVKVNPKFQSNLPQVTHSTRCSEPACPFPSAKGGKCWQHQGNHRSSKQFHGKLGRMDTPLVTRF